MRSELLFENKALADRSLRSGALVGSGRIELPVDVRRCRESVLPIIVDQSGIGGEFIESRPDLGPTIGFEAGDTETVLADLTLSTAIGKRVTTGFELTDDAATHTSN
jgi:hypothetical protein